MASGPTLQDADSRARRLLGALRAGATAFTGSGLKLRAMALTYISIFSLLPALMVAVSVVRRFVDLDRVRGSIQDFLVANLAVGAREAVTRFLEKHVLTPPEAASGLVGFALLLGSAVILLSQVEEAVNDIWAVRHRRPRLQRWLTYWAALTVGPLMAAGSVALALDAHDRIGAPRAAGQVALVLLTMAAFTGAYLVVPATRVRFWPALVGGVIAGGAFELAKGLYSWAAGHLFQFQALYGSLAAAFVFLAWLYLSWTLFLFGARLAFVLQHHRVLLDPSESSRAAIPRELLAVRALVEVALAWRDGEPPPDAGVVADRLEAAAEPVREVLGALEDAGLVRAGERGGLVPGRPVGQISLADVRAVFAGTAAIAPGEADLAALLLAEAEGAAAARLSERSIDDLCRSVRPPQEGADRPRSPAPGGGTARMSV